MIWRLASWRVAMMPSSLPHLAVADAAHGGQVGVQLATRTQGTYLVHKALRQHGVKALHNAIVQPASLQWFQGN